MTKLLLPAIFACLLNSVCYSQLVSPPPLTEQQKVRLAAVPEVKFHPRQRALTMPYAVDNSAKPYFRPLVAQVGLECGQASSIGLGLTYELNALRLLPGNVPQNQMATHFTYNFINGGSNAGVSFLESWEIVKRVGNPSVYDYGGIAYGGPSRWMSGYNLYYNAMHNRITDVRVIYINTVEGLNALRNWIYNHMGADTIGGVANFYSQTMSVTQKLPTGTPFGGQYVITAFGSSPNHAMTILGYNDSIRYDFNGDGRYTNDVDLNGDGVIDLKDWEIGGLKIANTYGSISNWANQGFSWAMYKAFAENPNSGGIWNNAVYISYAKKDLTPKLTMKVTLKHTSRNKLKVVAGVANNLSATEPEVTLNLPIMDYQGGDLYMKGGSTEDDKTLEFGLDATPLLSETVNGQPAKFFLMVQENDPSNQATGQIVSFDLVDYTVGTVTIPGGFSNVPLVENGLTTLSIPATISCSKPAIQNTGLPEANLYEPYSQQLNVSGGTPPYKWKFAIDYPESADTGSFPMVNAHQLSVNNTSSGYASQELPFAFPYYGKTYTRIYPHVDGYLMFDDHVVPWPYIIYEKTFLKNTKCISPYMGKPLVMMGEEGDGIWYQGCQDSVTFRWRLSVYGATPASDLNFAVTLYPNGHIRFYYGEMTTSSYMKWYSGLSNGDGLNYHFTSIYDSLLQPVAGSRFLFTPQEFPDGLSLTDNGLLYGTPLHSCNNIPLKFYVEDNNFLYTTRTLNFKTKGVEIAYQVSSGNDSLIEYGETAHVTPVLKNTCNTALHNVVMHLNVTDPYIIPADSIETIGTLNPGQTVSFPDAFSFSVRNTVPNRHILNLDARLDANEDTYTRTSQDTAWSAVPVISHVAVSDGNDNVLMPGETGNLLVTLHNSGRSMATNISAVLSVIDPYLTIQQGNAAFDTLDVNGSQVFTFTITAAATCPLGHIGFLDFHLTGDKDVILNDSVYVNIGPIIEDFETACFTRLPWKFSGNKDWIISQNFPYEGDFCSESGVITDNQESSMYVTLNVLTPSDISFYRKVSSEANYDFLYFYIDGQEQGKWAGEQSWEKFTYQVPAGIHSFRWRYRKDYSVSNGSDKAWVDYISWPPVANMLLFASAGPDDNACAGQGHQLSGQVINASSLWWSTSGSGTFMNINQPGAIYTPSANDLASGQVTLTIHASQNGLPGVTDNMNLNILYAPVVNAGPDGSVCQGDIFSITQAAAANQASVLWATSGDGSFDNPAYLNPVYTPGNNDQLSGTVTLILTASGPSGCTAVSDATLLTIHPAVVTNAGPDQTIAYNTSTQLSGSASGGSGTFSSSWEPSGMLVDPTVFNPVTTVLTNTQTFTLTATDNNTGCSSSDQILVTVTGGPLSVTTNADPATICPGGSSQLSATGTGGSGIYTYQWTSIPAGYSSALQNPTVTPAETTIYTVEINDGSASASGSVTVTIDTGPSAPAKPQGPNAVNVLYTAVTSYTTAGSPNATQYAWHFSPSDAGAIVPDGTDCDVQWNPSFEGIAALNLIASNDCGTSGPSDTLFITANSEVGQPDESPQSILQIYPNPGNGIFSVVLPEPGDYRFRIYNLQGKPVKEGKVQQGPDNLIFRLNMDGMPAGIYHLVISSNRQNLSGKLTLIQ